MCGHFPWGPLVGSKFTDVVGEYRELARLAARQPVRQGCRLVWDLLSCQSGLSPPPQRSIRAPALPQTL
jgi:hypothetical protein